MEYGKLLIAGGLALMSILMIPLGDKIIAGELEQTENERRCLRGRRIWKTGGLIGLAILLASVSVYGVKVPARQFLFLLYILLYCFLIGIVDAFSHNYYLEMLPGLLLFIPIGCITNGIQDSLLGLLAGTCLGCVAALSEWFFFRKTSCGGGDAIFCAASSALIGYENLLFYWFLLASIMLIASILHVVFGKAVKKQSLTENRFVPLLPWFSILTAGYYACSVFGALAGVSV